MIVERIVELDERMVELDERIVELDERMVELDERIVELDESMVEVNERIVEAADCMDRLAELDEAADCEFVVDCTGWLAEHMGWMAKFAD